MKRSSQPVKREKMARSLEGNAKASTLRSARPSVVAYHVGNTGSSTLDVARVSPENFYNLSICLRPHDSLVMRNGRQVHSGRVSRAAVGMYLPGDKIQVEASGPSEVLVLQLHTELLKNICGEAGFRQLETSSLSLRDPRYAVDLRLHASALRIARAMNSIEPFANLKIDLAAREAGIDVLSAYSDAGSQFEAKTAEAYKKGLGKDQLRTALEAMSDIEPGQITLAELARVVGCSATHFGRAFKISTGLSPFTWLVQRQIERAKTLLMTSDTPLAEVALDVGFSAQPQFTTAFRRVTGVSPGRWRAEHRS